MKVAIVAALMLVLQSLAGSFALGHAAASPVLLDIFGNPLCITSGLDSETDSDHGNHASLPDCCTIACSMFAPVTADERAPRSLHNPLSVVAAQLRPRFTHIPVSFALERGPSNPRAPPASVA